MAFTECPYLYQDLIIIMFASKFSSNIFNCVYKFPLHRSITGQKRLFRFLTGGVGVPPIYRNTIYVICSPPPPANLGKMLLISVRVCPITPPPHETLDPRLAHSTFGQYRHSSATKPKNALIHYSKKLKEHFDIMIFIERYPLKRCQGCVKLIAS